MSTKSRIIAYTKLCYKVKYDINKIIFVAYITTTHRQMNLILQHYIIQNGTNYISIKKIFFRIKNDNYRLVIKNYGL